MGENDIVCVYPLYSKLDPSSPSPPSAFASSGLFSFDDKGGFTPPQGGGNAPTGQLAVGKDDRLTLRPRFMVGSTIVNFFAKHLDHSHRWDTGRSIRIYTTEFFIALENCSWSKRELKWKMGNPFEEKIILVPLCYASHWRLLVLLNCGNVLDNDMAGPMCCILGVDSLSSDDRKVETKAVLIRAWLNAQWSKWHPNQPPNPFTPSTMPSFAPRSPKQMINQSINDCGIYVMMGMKRMYHLREESFLKEHPWFTRNFHRRTEPPYGLPEALDLRNKTAAFIDRLSNLQKSTLSAQADEADDSDLEVCDCGNCTICGGCD